MVNLNEKLEKNFNGNPFKLSIPILSVFKDKIILTTTLSFREKTPYGVVFVAARLTGGFGREYESNTEKCYFSAKKLHEELVVTIPNINILISLPRATEPSELAIGNTNPTLGLFEYF